MLPPLSFRKGKNMERLYEGILDLRLCSDYARMILNAVKTENRSITYKELSLLYPFLLKNNQSSEEIYGLLYPGEVLERYRDKTEDTLQKRRALLLALAICRDVFEKEMFHGDQYASFIIRCRKEAVKDLYLKSALYILTDNRNEKETLRNELFEYPYQKPEELFYVLVLMKEEVPEAWERWKNCLNDLLGVKREKNAYMYVPIYEWIIRNCIEQIRTSRGRNMALLKAIIKLPNTFAHEKNRVYEILSQNGYKKEEIFYLNVWMLRYGIGSYSAGRRSITTVRAVEKFCIWVCSQEEEYPDDVYRLCKELIQDFKEYPVHIGGQEGILEAMHCQVQVKNVKVYLLLYELRNIRNFNWSWLHIDLRAAKYEPLLEKLGQKEFQHYVEKTLADDNFTKEELLIYLERYRRLMGTDYRTVMFQKYDDKYNRIFQKLCDRHLLDPVRLTKSILLEGAIRSDRKEIYERYLGEYVRKADSPQKMRVLSLFSKKYSAAKLKDIFQIPDFWIQTVNIRKGSWRKFEDMNFLKGKLNVGMIRQLFRWVEEAVFREMTESYVEFLLYLLKNKENKIWIPQDVGREMCKELEKYEGDASFMNYARKLYFKQEEIDAYNRRVAEERKSEAEKKKREEQQKVQDTIANLADLDEAKFLGKIRWEILGLGSSRNNAAVVKQFVQKHYIMERHVLTACSEYLTLIMKLRDLGTINAKEAIEIIKNTEVEQNDSENSAAFANL